MNRNIFRSILGIVALSAIGTANAAVFTLPTTGPGPTLNIGDTGTIPTTQPSAGAFVDDFFFTLASLSQLSSNVTNVALSGFGFSSLGAQLYDVTTSSFVPGGTGLNFTLPSLTGGNEYELIVSGTANSPLGGIFSGAVYVTSPVPIPAAAWLLLSGLVGVGAMARRRKIEALS
jgi:hypothetical protein